MMHAHLHIPRVCVNCQSNSLCVCASGTKMLRKISLHSAKGKGKSRVLMSRWENGKGRRSGNGGHTKPIQFNFQLAATSSGT